MEHEEKPRAFLDRGLDFDTLLPMLAGMRSPSFDPRASEPLAGCDPAYTRDLMRHAYTVTGCVADTRATTAANSRA